MGSKFGHRIHRLDLVCANCRKQACTHFHRPVPARKVINNIYVRNYCYGNRTRREEFRAMELAEGGHG